jgi:hypothetical protein
MNTDQSKTANNQSAPTFDQVRSAAFMNSLRTTDPARRQRFAESHQRQVARQAQHRDQFRQRVLNPGK